ncbi:MAG: carboxymuconolactone decarboxylase family protein [Anaerolineae bacterium]
MSDLPMPYTDFREEFPEVAAAYDALGSAAHDAGPLDDRTRQLVKLAIAIGGRQEGAVKAHARRAFEMGISLAEIKHVILLALTTCGFPTTVAAYTWVNHALKED